MSALVRDALAVLRSAGVELSPGLISEELAEIENRFGFAFGPDHRELLLAAVPVGEQWVDWRRDLSESISDRLAWPVESALFDVRHGSFWAASWGPKPITETDALALARRELERWPTLVPIYSHRYLPAAPVGHGAPVFSVHSTDVIYYGGNLLDYFQREFDGRRYEDGEAATIDVPPWSLLATGYEDIDL